MVYPAPMADLIEELKRLPGIGPKSAQRLALYVFGSPRSQIEKLSQLLLSAKDAVTFCEKCFCLTDRSPCDICSGRDRQREVLCVVAEPKDVMALERSGAHRGLYHVMGGLLSPLDGIGPDQLRTRELVARLKDGAFEEIILALNPTIEGETTAAYLHRLIQPLGIKLTRIATGLPIGSDMDFADELTLAKAMEGRREG
jgi:recombination protein RecR